jgi:hypothetical protein
MGADDRDRKRLLENGEELRMIIPVAVRLPCGQVPSPVCKADFVSARGLGLVEFARLSSLHAF